MKYKYPEAFSYIDTNFQDERLQKLVRKVWYRLPGYDRHVLRKRILDINDRGSDENTLGYTRGVEPDTYVNGCAAQMVEDLQHTVWLRKAKETKSDAACMCVIAHEFAHVVLRHYEMTLLVAQLLGFETIYTEENFNDLDEWHEDAANLQVWLWGFKDELEAHFKEHPEARRPRWYVELQTEPGERPGE